MIASLLLKYGIPAWAAELLIAVLALGASVAWYDHKLSEAHSAGVGEEAARNDAETARNTALAQSELLDANGRLREAQEQLAAAQADLQKLQQENNHEKAISNKRQRDLAVGVERERVLVHVTSACHPAQAGQAESASATPMDNGPGAEADLDPGVAGWLEGVRSRHNDAVDRLNACISAYRAVKRAADTP